MPTTDEALALLLGVLIGVVVGAKLVAWLVIAAVKMIAKWAERAI